MSELTNVKNELPDKDYLYRRYNEHSDGRAKLDLKNRQWQSKLHKQVAHKALDEPMMDDDMGDIRVHNTGISGKALIGLAALALPLVGLGGAGAAVLLNQVLNNSPPPIEKPTEQIDTDRVTVPGLTFGPDRPQVDQ